MPARRSPAFNGGWVDDVSLAILTGRKEWEYEGWVEVEDCLTCVWCLEFFWLHRPAPEIPVVR